MKEGHFCPPEPWRALANPNMSRTGQNRPGWPQALFPLHGSVCPAVTGGPRPHPAPPGPFTTLFNVTATWPPLLYPWGTSFSFQEKADPSGEGWSSTQGCTLGGGGGAVSTAVGMRERLGQASHPWQPGCGCGQQGSAESLVLGTKNPVRVWPEEDCHGW